MQVPITDSWTWGFVGLEGGSSHFIWNWNRPEDATKSAKGVEHWEEILGYNFFVRNKKDTHMQMVKSESFW